MSGYNAAGVQSMSAWSAQQLNILSARSSREYIFMIFYYQKKEMDKKKSQFFGLEFKYNSPFFGLKFKYECKKYGVYLVPLDLICHLR